MNANTNTNRRHDGLSHARSRQWSRRDLMKGASAIGLGSTSLASLISHSPAAAAQAASDADLVRLGSGQAATWTRNFNPFVPGFLWSADYGIHEPLLIQNTATGETVPWLASEWAFNDDNTELTFTIRPDVLWSDGEPFTAKDVEFTFNLLLEQDGLSGSGSVRAALPYVESLAAPDDQTFTVRFKQVFTPALYDLGQQVIVPMHVWAEVADPVTFANEEPVGTGPFTEVTDFQSQYWELRKNPNYWQEGKPAVEGFALPAYSSNEVGTLALINGEFDWANLFIPAIEETYIAKDPEHFNYWYPLTGSAIFFFANTTIPPFDDVNVRRALSLAINRQQITTVAVYDYTHPADATGMSQAYEAWKSQEVIDAGQEWVTYNVERANQLLDEAGLVREGDIRRTADGAPMEYEMIVPSGWSDWVQGLQMIEQDLAKVGIRAKVSGLNTTAWNNATFRGEFTFSLGSIPVGATPFNHFSALMSAANIRPVGEVTTLNWHRYESPEIDRLLEAFAATSDQEEQLQLSYEMQQLFLDEWPAVPMYPGPVWGEFSTRRFEGFPSEENPYAPLARDEPTTLLVMTALTPVPE